MGARYYDPTLGRFTQQDQLSALADPANGNRYAYTGDDPINYSDPSGRCSGITDCISSAANTVSDAANTVSDAVTGNPLASCLVGGLGVGIGAGTAVVFSPLTGGAAAVAGAAVTVGAAGLTLACNNITTGHV